MSLLLQAPRVGLPLILNISLLMRRDRFTDGEYHLPCLVTAKRRGFADDLQNIGVGL